GVAARTSTPGDRAVAGGQAAGREGLDDAAAWCLDAECDPRGPRELEARRDARARGARGQKAQRVVERELAVGDRVPSEIVVRDRGERPRTLGLPHSRPVELVVAGRPRARI